MGVVVTDSETKAPLREQSRTRGVSAPRLFEPRATTLEDAILAVWEDLAAGRRAECPVCGGSISMLAGCERCGSELS